LKIGSNSAELRQGARRTPGFSGRELDRIASARGHSLNELVVLLGVIAILAGSAVTTALRAVDLARLLAATRGETIRLCGIADGRGRFGKSDQSAGLPHCARR
jgi:hypothetical protein